jgi:hypothetical protein
MTFFAHKAFNFIISSMNLIFTTNYLKAHAAVQITIDRVEYIMSVLCCAYCKLETREKQVNFQISFDDNWRRMCQCIIEFFSKIALNSHPYAVLQSLDIITGFCWKFLSHYLHACFAWKCLYERECAAILWSKLFP